MLEGLGSWPRMVSGCEQLLKQEILLWMTHKDPLSGGGWGGRMSGPIGHIGHFLKGFLQFCSRKAQDRVAEAEK